jgi:thiamine biosynthesis lipoprotein
MSHWHETEYRRLRPFLGTFVEVRVRGLQESAAVATINQAFEHIAIVERYMSAHNPDGDLGCLFRAQDSQVVAVHPWTFEVIEAAQRLHHLSGGVFDVTVGAILERNGFLPTWQNKRRAQSGGTMGDIELLDKPRLRRHCPVRLDLGGIAKGFAVDRAVETLMAAGASAGSVNAGGDFRIFGAANEALLVRDPAAPQRILRIGTIQTGAVATSSGYFRCRWNDSQPRTPYIDGRTGDTLDLRDSVTVIAASCMWADALTKVLAVDWQTGAALLDCFNAKAFLIRAPDGPSSPLVCPLGTHRNLRIRPRTV